MKYKQLLAIIAGFGTIGLLSSVFAKIQGSICPESLTMLGRSDLHQADIIQLGIKLVCLFISCVLGGMLIRQIGGNRKASIVAGGMIMIVVAWLWYNIRQPAWFWIISLIQVMPAVWIGNTTVMKHNRS